MSKKDDDKIIYTIHDCLDFYYVYTRYMYGYILPQEMLIEVFPKTEESKLKKIFKERAYVYIKLCAPTKNRDK